MKRLTAILLFLCMLCSFALADEKDSFKLSYNAAAQVYGAPQVTSSVKSNGNFHFRISDAMRIILEPNEITGKIQTVYVVCDSSAEEGDFLCACLAVMGAYYDMDVNAHGMLLEQFAKVKAGKENAYAATTKSLNQLLVMRSAAYKYIFCFVRFGV